MVADAVTPAGLTPQKESAPAAQTAQSRQQNEPRNSATGAGGDKAFLALRALLALKGHVLSRTHGDVGPVCFHVNCRGLVRELPNIASVRAFAEQVGTTHA